MASSVKITITKNGQVVDEATASFSALLDQTEVVDVLAAAFEAAYGLYSYDNPDYDPNQPESDTNKKTISVNPYRNVTYRFRRYGEEIAEAYTAKQLEAERAAKMQQFKDVTSTVTTIQ